MSTYIQVTINISKVVAKLTAKYKRFHGGNYFKLEV